MLACELQLSDLTDTDNKHQRERRPGGAQARAIP